VTALGENTSKERKAAYFGGELAEIKVALGPVLVA
jgi:hypothetical protein